LSYPKYCLLLIGALLTGAAVAADYEVGDHLTGGGKGETTQHDREVSWDDLLPKDWDPMKEIKGLNLDELSDDDPRAEAAAEKLKAMWNKAPSNPAINGRAIRIAGFMVPLEFGKKAVTEFLLVPSTSTGMSSSLMSRGSHCQAPAGLFFSSHSCSSSIRK